MQLANQVIFADPPRAGEGRGLSVGLLRKSRHLSWFELALAAAVVGTLMGVFLERASRVEVLAEQASLASAVSNLNTGLNLVAAMHLINGDRQALVGLAGGNPMLAPVAGQDGAEIPKVTGLIGRYSGYTGAGAAYLGLHADTDARAIAGGFWYFDPVLRALVYRVRNGAHFVSPLTGPPRARFQVRLVYRDRDGSGRFEPDRDVFQAVRLVAMEEYRWLSP